MPNATAVRRAMLVLGIGVPALGAAILIPSCTARTAHASPGRPAATRQAASARPRTGTRHPAAAARPAPRRPPAVPDEAGVELARTLAPVLRGQPGRLAAGVVNEHTGAVATYHGSWPFDTASIIKADILAVLLIQHQQTGTTPSSAERQLAATMIEGSDNNAATALWDQVEGGAGLEAGNAVLGLRHTRPSPTGAWALTTTTVTDQLRLLTDLTSARSPLDAASRGYELSLMRHVEAGQNWGITTAADPGSDPVVKNGWLPVSSGWVINSIGIVTHAGQQLLIAVLSTGTRTENDGISQVQAAAKAAAAAATSVGVPDAATGHEADKRHSPGGRVNDARVVPAAAQLLRRHRRSAPGDQVRVVAWAVHAGARRHEHPVLELENAANTYPAVAGPRRCTASVCPWPKANWSRSPARPGRARPPCRTWPARWTSRPATGADRRPGHRRAADRAVEATCHPDRVRDLAAVPRRAQCAPQ